MTGESSEGVLTAEQMRRCLFAEMRTSYVDIELNEMLKALDQDNDGKVTKEEFVNACLSQNLGTGNLSAKLALGIVDVFVTE